MTFIDVRPLTMPTRLMLVLIALIGMKWLIS